MSDSRDGLEMVVLFLSMEVRALKARLASGEPGALTMRAPPPENENPVVTPSSTIKMSLKDAAFVAGISESQMRKR